MTSKNKKLSREDWLIIALDTLKLEGMHKVTVEYLAHKLSVTKGSFYWHFKNRAALLNEMLSYWAERLTTQIIDRNYQTAPNAKQRLFSLMHIVTSEKLGRYETAIRSWATHDKLARRVVTRVDKQRYQYIKALFIEAGCSTQEAELRSRILIYYQVAEASIFLGDSKSTQQQLLQRRFELLTFDLP